MKPKFVILEDSVYEEMLLKIKAAATGRIRVKLGQEHCMFAESVYGELYTNDEALKALETILKSRDEEIRQLSAYASELRRQSKELRWWHFRKIKELRKSA
jgi:hypothetical protein